MRLLALVLACAGCAAGTATGATSGRRAALPISTLRARDTKAVDHDGVGIVAGIITWDSARRYKDAMVVVHWLEANDRLPTMRAGNVGTVGKVSERWGEVPVMPMPTFMLGIANRTDHVVRIDASQFDLVDAAGDRYAPFTDLGAIEGRIEEQLTGTYRGLLGAQGVRESLHNKIGQIHFLTSAVEVKPGEDWVGFVPFQVPLQTPAEFSHFADRVKQVALRYTDQRGTVPLLFDRQTGNIQVTCPDDERATLERCPPGGAMPRPSPQGP